MIDYYEKQLFYNCMAYCKTFFTVLTLNEEKQNVPEALTKSDINEILEAEIKHLDSCRENISLTIQELKKR